MYKYKNYLNELFPVIFLKTAKEKIEELMGVGFSLLFQRFINKIFVVISLSPNNLYISILNIQIYRLASEGQAFSFLFSY